jgi:hypothetical protein
MRESLRRQGIRAVVLAGAVASVGLQAGRASAARSVGFAPVPGRGAPSKSPATPFAGMAGQCGVITYCGGPVISSVQAVPVYWTNQVSQTITSWAPDYLHLLVNSALLDMLSEYSTAGKTGEVCSVQTDAGLGYFGPSTASSTGQTITRGSALAAVTITPTVTMGTNIVDDNAAIGAELVAQIHAGNLPAPTYDAQGYPNTFYVVFFPSSYSISIQNFGSCMAFGGYHYSGPYTASPTCKSQYIPYAVIPDCSGRTPVGAVSHELAEAVTDTDVGPTEPSMLLGDGAWYLGPSYPCNDPQSCPMNCGEVGDVCEQAGSALIPGSSVESQNIWSQAQNGCDVSNPAIGTQNGPAPLAMCPASASGSGGSDGGASSGATDSGTDATTSSSSGSTSSGGSSSGGGGAGSTSSGSSGTSGSGGSSGSTSSSGSSGSFGGGSSGSSGHPSIDGSTGDDGGLGDTGGGASSGCGCEAAGSHEVADFGALAMLAGGVAALARGRRGDRRRLPK